MKYAFERDSSQKKLFTYPVGFSNISKLTLHPTSWLRNLKGRHSNCCIRGRPIGQVQKTPGMMERMGSQRNRTENRRTEVLVMATSGVPGVHRT